MRQEAMKGVRPFLSGKLRSAPLATSFLAMEKWPLAQAALRGVTPFSSDMLGLYPWLKSVVTVLSSPFSQAVMNLFFLTSSSAGCAGCALGSWS